MQPEVRFQPIKLAGQYEGEEAQLAWVDDHLAVVLVRVADAQLAPHQQGWCVEAGFGPCRGEGRLFPTLERVEAWIRSQIPTSGWPESISPAVRPSCLA